MQDLMIVIEDVLDKDEYELWRLEYEGYTQKEIAKMYECHKSTVCRWLQAVKEKLKKCL